MGIGTLGASKLNQLTTTDARKQENRAVATGWRLKGINNMVDSVVSAADKLEKEMELEAKYWDDVLSVSESGWAVCHVPTQGHTLGVRFGFSESAPEFKNSSIAPLRRNDDGSARLDLGPVGRGSQRVRVTRKKNGRIIDQSPLPGRTPDNAPLHDRVLEARNTAFHQELWYEMNREARTLLSSEVYPDATTIVWKRDSQTEIIFTLEDLAEPDNAYEHISNIQCSCTAYYIYIQFLLFQGHRQNYHKRTTSTHLANNRAAMQQPYAILRAVIANSEYFRDCKRVADFLEDLVYTLKRAGISTASCKSASQPLMPALQASPTRRTPKMELNFINHLAGRLESVFELTITPEAKLYARGRIVIIPYIGVLFGVSLTPFYPHPIHNNNNSNASAMDIDEDKEKPPPNPIALSYPPSDPFKEPYPNTGEAIYYIKQAAIRAVVQKLAKDTADKLGRDDIEWGETARGPGVVDREDTEARVDVAEDARGRLVLVLDAQWQHGANVATRRWTWRADRDAEDGETLADVVRNVMRGAYAPAQASALALALGNTAGH